VNLQNARRNNKDTRGNVFTAQYEQNIQIKLRLIFFLKTVKL